MTDYLALNPLDAGAILRAFGIAAVLVIMFVETGLLVGFFFPGDSLLFLAGIASSSVADQILKQGNAHLSLPVLLIGAPICAIAGAQLGHWLGARYGPRMFARPNSRIFKQEYVAKAEYYFTKFGPPKAVVFARFIPIVRTFLNPVAGMLGMPAGRFFVWNVVGGILWTDGILLIGYGLAKQISATFPLDKYLLPAVVVIVLLSLTPVFIEMYRARRDKRRDVGQEAP